MHILFRCKKCSNSSAFDKSTGQKPVQMKTMIISESLYMWPSLPIILFPYFAAQWGEVQTRGPNRLQPYVCNCIYQPFNRSFFTLTWRNSSQQPMCTIASNLIQQFLKLFKNFLCILSAQFFIFPISDGHWGITEFCCNSLKGETALFTQLSNANDEIKPISETA